MSEQTTLKEDDVNSFYEFDESYLRQEKEASKELYKWQENAIKYFFDNENTAIYEVPTGTGKTFFFIELLKIILERYPSTPFLIAVPKNVILETTWYKELCDNGIPIQNVGVYYGNIKEYAPITITNMQNLDKIDFSRFKDGGICLDEIHNFGTDRLIKILTGQKWKYMVGLTATLTRQDNKHWEIAELFNYNIFRYSAMQAMTDKIISPFELVNISIEMDADMRERYDKITFEINSMLKMAGGYTAAMKSDNRNAVLSKMNLRKQMVNNYPRKFDIVKAICKKHDGEKIIVFNEYNEVTSKVYWHLLDDGIRSCIIHSDIPKEKREQALIDFRTGKFNVILASRILDEGYNLPSISCAVLSAGNSTNRQTIQRVGRVLRKQKGKLATIYLLTVADTIEEKYGEKKVLILKELADDYKQIRVNLDEVFEI